MSKRPTPETDSARLNHSLDVVDADFARRLERERDEALAALRFSLGMSCFCPICNRTSAEQPPNKEANK